MESICLTVVMGKDGKPTPLPIPQKMCHCNGKHFIARGEISEKDKQIKINNEDYLKFLGEYKNILS